MKIKLFVISILAGLSIYIYAIISIPGFISDDFLIFTYISQHPNNPIALDPNIDFFLFTRPISYFTFWIDYILLGNESLLIKFNGLFFLCCSVLLMYLTLKKLMHYLKVDVSKKLIFLGTLFYFLHPDSLLMVTWISNKTEVINIIFYLTTILLFLTYFENTKSKHLIFSVVSYLLAVLTKQQSIHLPIILLLIFLFYFRRRYHYNYKTIIFYFISLFTLFAATSIINIYFGQESIPIVIQNFWKKPFSIISITLFSIQPLVGEWMLSYFIMHKNQALALLIIILLIFIFFYRKYKVDININNKMVISVLLFYLISFYPRLLAASGTRINTVQIFWLIVIIFLISIWIIKLARYKSILLSIVILFNLANFVYSINKELRISTITNKRIAMFDKEFQDSEVFIIACPDILLLPYQLFYFRNGIFGKELMYKSSIHFRTIRGEQDAIEENKVRCNLFLDQIEVKSTKLDIYLHFDELNEEENSRITNLIPSLSGRGYGVINYIPGLIEAHKKLVYFDGKEWIELKSIY